MPITKEIVEDLRGAGYSIKKTRENERISDLDLRHIFEKVDVNQDNYVNRMVGIFVEILEKRNVKFYTSQEMRMACRYLCKQFNFNYKRVNL